MTTQDPGHPRVRVRDGADTGVSVELARVRDPVTIVIFGASGDLAQRKLIPALFHLANAGGLPDRFAVVGFSRTPLSDDAYRDAMREAIGRHSGVGAPTADHPLLTSLFYQAGNNDDPASFDALRARIEGLERERDLAGNRLYYFSVAPQFFPALLRNLAGTGLIYDRTAPQWSRVVLEKPFGHDLDSARALSAAATAVLDESQIYRIDHYLGKETVQNLLGFRFGNSIFEPLFNQRYVDHVQITVAETVGMEGRRGAYFDTAGMLRDIVQNHMLQLLCLLAMEPPSALEAESIRGEKVKVLRALVTPDVEEVGRTTIRGQYGLGEQNGAIVKGYRQEEGVDPASITETYVALRCRLDNWRWAGVPFLLRAGKRLAKRATEIAVQFRQPPLHLFRHLGTPHAMPQSNVLVLRIQPNEGISLSFACKQPGMHMHLQAVEMDFFYQEVFAQRSPDAYERLLLDAMRGDASLFTRSDEVDYAWRYITAVLDGWAALPPPAFPNYYPFTDGPREAATLVDDLHGGWRPVGEM